MTEPVPNIDFMEGLRPRQPYRPEAVVPARRRDGDEHLPGREPALPIRRRDGDEEPPRPPHPVAPEMSKYSFSDLYTLAARHYANAFLSDVDVQEQPDRRRARYDHANLAQLQILQNEKSAFQATLETRLDAPGMETKYTSHAPTTKWQAALEGLKFWKPYIYNTQDKEETRRGIQEVREAYRDLNTPQGLAAASAEAGNRAYARAYLAPQEVGEIVDQLHSKAARAAVRQLAIDAGYVAPLDDLKRFGNYEAQVHQANFTLIKPLDNRMGQREGDGVESAWRYDDSYNFKRAVKLGEMGRAALRQGAIVGLAALSGGTSAAASALASVIALPAIAAPIGHAINTNIADYIDNTESARSVSAVATIGLLTAGSLGVQYATGVDLSGFVPYLAGMTGLVTASEFCHTRSRRTESQRARGNWTLTSAIFDYLILPWSIYAKPIQSDVPSDAPTIDMTLQSEQNGSVLKTGDTLNYTINVDDKPNFGDAIKDVNVAINRPDGSVVSEHLYANENLDKVHAFFGDSHTTDKGSFEANTTGDYKMTITASDTQGHTTEKSYDFAVTEQGATPVHPHEPGESDTTEPGVCDPDEPQTPGALEDCVKERFTYGKDIHKGVELREVYDYHATPLTPETGHEQGLTLDHWKSGSVSLNNVYDEHTPCDFNVDNTVVMLEHYTDAKALDYRVLVDVDASGHFEIPKEFAAYKGDDIQVTWASVTHCEDGKLGLEDLASYTHGKHVVIPDEAVFSGTVPAHVAPQYIDCDGTAAVTPAPKHSDVPTDDCGPCAKPCDQEYYVPVGVIDSKAGPCPEGTPVMSSNAFVPAGTLDSVVNTFGYMPSDVSAASVGPVPGSLDTAVNPFGYTPDAATPVDAPAGTLDQHVNPFDGVAPETLAPTGVPEETRTPDINPYNLDDEDATITYNLGQYYEETYYIDDEVLRAFERQQQAALELRLA